MSWRCLTDTKNAVIRLGFIAEYFEVFCNKIFNTVLDGRLHRSGGGCGG